MKSILFSFLIVTTSISFAQEKCKPYRDDCFKIEKGGFMLSKSRVLHVYSKKTAEKSIYELTFTKGMSYLVSVCDVADYSGDVKIEILDKNDKPLSTNYFNNEYYPKVRFDCKSTDKYYVKYSFPDTGNGCALTSIGFKKL